MPITVGEVEAVLSARDIMSPAMINAAERVKSLEYQLKNLAVSSGDSADKVQDAADRINWALMTAQENFNKLATLNQGSVQQALARTQASMQQTAANAVQLGTAVNQAGTATAAAGANIAQAGTAATQMANAVTQTGTAAVNAASGVSQVGSAAANAGQNMGQVEGIAMRLIERMLILYALRGTFQFVVGLYEAADALVKLSASTDLSLDKLQMLQAGAEDSGVAFTKVTSAIDTLDKNLAENKIKTQDALESIGLSFAQVFALKPEERFDAIVHAIGALPDKLSRTKAEVALFGSDAIDPLVKNYDALTLSANATNRVMGSDTIRTLAYATEAYSIFFRSVKTEASDFYAYMIEHFASGVTSFSNAVMGPLGDNKNPTGPRDIFLPSDDQGGGDSGNIEITVKGYVDYIDKLKQAASGVRALTEEQVKQLLQLKQLNLLTEDNAAALTKDGINIGLNTEQYKRFTAAMKDMTAVDKAAEQYAQAWEKAVKQTEALWDRDIEAMAKRSKVTAQINDDQAKDREQRDLKENADRLARGVITDNQFFLNKAAIEYQYYQRHNDLLKANEVYSLNTLKNQEDKELSALESEFARGLIDEQTYQQDRAAIVERYASERLSVEDKFNSDMDIRRRQEIDKEIADRKAAVAQEEKDRQTAAAAAQNAQAKQQNLDQGGSMDINRGNLDQNAAYWNIPASAAEAMAARGFSFQEIVSAWQSGTVSKWIPHGPRIPGFATGGTVDIMVGEHGPEAIRAPIGTQVAPSGSSFGGGSVTVNMHISGLLDPSTVRTLTDAMEKELIRRSKTSQLFGSR